MKKKLFTSLLIVVLVVAFVPTFAFGTDISLKDHTTAEMTGNQSRTASASIDTTAPVINSLSINNADAVNAKGNVKIDIDVTEDGTGVWYVDFCFENEDGHTAYLNWSGAGVNTGTEPLFYTGKKTLNIPVNNAFGNGKYKLSCIFIADRNENIRDYYSEDFERMGINSEINVINSTADTKAPVINSLSWGEESIKTPAALALNVDVIEDGTGVWTISMYFENEEGHNLFLWWYGKGMCNGVDPLFNTGKVQRNVLISPFSGEGTYTLKCVQIRDRSDNTRNYQFDELDEIVTNKTLNIKSSFDIAYYGSLGNVNGALSNIDAMEEGKTIVLDCRDSKVAPKSIFTRIAGKNKTVVFEDEDVQWVFNGKNITVENCKSINLTTTIKTAKGEELGFLDDNKVVVITFRNNGILPGEADVRINDAYITSKYAGSENNLVLSYIDGDFPKVEDTDVKVEDDNAAVIEIDHNSKFTLSQGKPKKRSLTKVTTAKKSYTFTGKSIKPGINVFATDKKIESRSYTKSFSNNINVGKAKVTVKGKGLTKGTVYGTYTILPKGSYVYKLTKAKKAFTVKWKKQSAKMSKSRISGYQIQYSTSSAFKSGNKTVKVKGYSKISKKIAKLKAKKKYYVRVRTYKTVAGKTYYSVWSAKKSIITK